MRPLAPSAGYRSLPPRAQWPAKGLITRYVEPATVSVPRVGCDKPGCRMHDPDYHIALARANS